MFREAEPELYKKSRIGTTGRYGALTGLGDDGRVGHPSAVSETHERRRRMCWKGRKTVARHFGRTDEVEAASPDPAPDPSFSLVASVAPEQIIIFRFILIHDSASAWPKPLSIDQII